MSRLLAIRPGGVGDCILSFPAIESLRTRCEYLEVWTPRAVTPLVQFADRVRAISATGLDLFGLEGLAPDPRLVETLSGFDAIISWYGTNREDFRSAAAALNLPIEFHAALPPAEGSTIHACDFFCAQVGAPLGMIPRVPPIGHPSNSDSSSNSRLLSRDRRERSAANTSNNQRAGRREFIAIHPFSGSPRKNWPLDRFDAVARTLGLPVEWCATPEQSATLVSRSPLLALDDLSQLANWLAEARVYIGNDSGITHLAAAVGTPVVALFGASDPVVWAPRGKCVNVITKSSMDAIAIEPVVAAAKSLW